jgi:isopentenyldiphosphate isomerase
MRLYPNFWNGISGFLDDDRSLEDKVREELHEELGIAEESIVSMMLGDVFLQDAPQYQKTWIVHPILVAVSTDQVSTDWEAQVFRWIRPDEVKHFDVMPGFELVLERLFDSNGNTWSISRGENKTKYLF